MMSVPWPLRILFLVLLLQMPFMLWEVFKLWPLPLAIGFTLLQCVAIGFILFIFKLFWFTSPQQIAADFRRQKG